MKWDQADYVAQIARLRDRAVFLEQAIRVAGFAQQIPSRARNNDLLLEFESLESHVAKLETLARIYVLTPSPKAAPPAASASHSAAPVMAPPSLRPKTATERALAAKRSASAK